MFMWRRHSLWPNITVLCSGDEHGCEKWLTKWPGARYPQNQKNTGFFSNVTTVLPPLRFIVDYTRIFWGSEESSRELAWSRSLMMADLPHNSG